MHIYSRQAIILMLGSLVLCGCATRGETTRILSTRLYNGCTNEIAATDQGKRLLNKLCVPTIGVNVRNPDIGLFISDRFQMRDGYKEHIYKYKNNVFGESIESDIVYLVNGKSEEFNDVFIVNSRAGGCGHYASTVVNGLPIIEIPWGETPYAVEHLILKDSGKKLVALSCLRTGWINLMLGDLSCVDDLIMASGCLEAIKRHDLAVEVDRILKDVGLKLWVTQGSTVEERERFQQEWTNRVSASAGLSWKGLWIPSLEVEAETSFRTKKDHSIEKAKRLVFINEGQILGKTIEAIQSVYEAVYTDI